jgi:hypothetical protein
MSRQSCSFVVPVQDGRQGTRETAGLKPGAEACAREPSEIHGRRAGLSDHLSIDAIGFVAAGLVLATFSMRSMCALRWTALASNLIFIAYGYLGNLAPVLLLHALLLPVNAYRLTQLGWAGRRRSAPAEQDGIQR